MKNIITLTDKEINLLLAALAYFNDIENRREVLSRYGYKQDEMSTIGELEQKLLDI